MLGVFSSMFIDTFVIVKQSNVTMLNVVMPSVVAPFKTSGKCQKVGYTYFMSSQNKLDCF